MELSFGEQIKILLKRKNMTIKELADLYVEKTGMPTLMDFPPKERTKLREGIWFSSMTS